MIPFGPLTPFYGLALANRFSWIQAMRCPCESGLKYAECCQAYHARRSVAPTAEALMRSRYAAYVLGESE